MGGLLQGGTIEEFYKGVTGITGEPHPDLKEGVCKEHCDMLDSLEVYTSGNYGISTVPKTEYEIVVGGGEGLETIQVKQPDGITFVEHVKIPNTANLKSLVRTRGPVKEGQVFHLCSPSPTPLTHKPQRTLSLLHVCVFQFVYYIIPSRVVLPLHTYIRICTYTHVHVRVCMYIYIHI